MPGPAAHVQILELQRAKALGSADHQVVAQTLLKHRSFAALGSMGPDMLFWADWGEFTPVVNLMFDVYSRFDDVYDKVMAVWQPIQDAVDKTLGALTGGLWTSVQDTLKYAEAVILTEIQSLILSNFDLMGLIYKP